MFNILPKDHEESAKITSYSYITYREMTQKFGNVIQTMELPFPLPPPSPNTQLVKAFTFPSDI